MTRIPLSLLVGTFLVGVSTLATAGNDDLVNCIYGSSGLPIQPKVCEYLRRVQAEEALEQQENQRRFEEIQTADRERRRREAESAETRRQQLLEQERIRSEREAKRVAEEAVERQTRVDAATLEAEERLLRQRKIQEEYAREEAARRAEVEELKRICGDDYGRVRVGMTFARAQQCVGEFSMVSQTSRADGVLTTYARGSGYIYVMGGEIVAWDHY